MINSKEIKLLPIDLGKSSLNYNNNNNVIYNNSTVFVNKLSLTVNYVIIIILLDIRALSGQLFGTRMIKMCIIITLIHNIRRFDLSSLPGGVHRGDILSRGPPKKKPGYAPG